MEEIDPQTLAKFHRVKTSQQIRTTMEEVSHQTVSQQQHEYHH